MKVAWFTPFNERSAIGEFAHQVTTQLARHVNVEIWSPDVGEVRASEVPIRRFALEPERLAHLKNFDHLVYNIGDHVRYHATIYETSRRHPGIVILNDRTYQHFFAAYWIERNRGARYVERMDAIYGPAGRRVAEDSIAGSEASTGRRTTTRCAFRSSRTSSRAPVERSSTRVACRLGPESLAGPGWPSPTRHTLRRPVTPEGRARARSLQDADRDRRSRESQQAGAQGGRSSGSKQGTCRASPLHRCGPLRRRRCVCELPLGVDRPRTASGHGRDSRVPAGCGGRRLDERGRPFRQPSLSGDGRLVGVARAATRPRQADARDG